MPHGSVRHLRYVDLRYYLELRERVGQDRAVLSVARTLLRRAHHTLRKFGDDALLPAA